LSGPLSRSGTTAVEAVADALGMNINTARDFVWRAKGLPSSEAFLDHRVEPNPSHPTKLKKEYTDLLRLWLEENCTLPVNTPLARLSQEISRAPCSAHRTDMRKFIVAYRDIRTVGHAAAPPSRIRPTAEFRCKCG